MPYTNCSVCGAKALVGATRCPRCQAPFVSYEVNGERVPTVNCPNCGVQRPVAIGVCPNCLMSTAPSGRRLVRGLVLASVAIAALMAVGYAISRRVEGTASTGSSATAIDTVLPGDTAVARRTVTDTLPSPLPATNTAIPTSAGVEAPTVTNAMRTAATLPPNVSPATTTTPSPAVKPAPPPSVAVPDTGRWEAAVATTWVRVRSAPTRESDVLRMVDSAQRVRLGPPQNGWRPVRVGVDRGWVDPRLFSVIPAPKP